MGDLALLDWICLGLVGLALLRGFAIGMIREAFSIAALGAAVIAIRLWTAPGAEWLTEHGGLGLGPLGSKVAAGAALGLGVLLTVSYAGRVLRRGARAVGLGLLDRLAGGALGAGEGLLATCILLIGLVNVLGTSHPALAHSRSLALFERVEQIAQNTGVSDVAAPPP